MTDDQLVARAQAGDLPAFEELVQKYQREVYGLACRMVSDAEEAKDLAQQAFLQAFVHIRSFRQDAQFRTWLFRIAINQCYNFLKSRRKFGDPIDCDELNLAGDEPSPEADLVAQGLVVGWVQADSHVSAARRQVQCPTRLERAAARCRSELARGRGAGGSQFTDCGQDLCPHRHTADADPR